MTQRRKLGNYTEWKKGDLIAWDTPFGEVFAGVAQHITDYCIQAKRLDGSMCEIDTYRFKVRKASLDDIEKAVKVFKKNSVKL